jgi:hypothetical protein
MRNGVSVSSDGKIITCAYSLDTAGGYPGVGLDDLVKANQAVVASVDAFYAKNGHHRCILRHAKYGEFVKSLPGGKKASGGESAG